MRTASGRFVTQVGTLALAMALVAGALAPANAKKANDLKSRGAELAFRWAPNEGGPTDATDALATLGIKEKKEADHYRVTYLTVEHFPVLPGFCSILRQRHSASDGEYELTLKFRGDSPLPTPAATNGWACPLDAGGKLKNEVDITVLADKVLKKYSRSCSVEANNAPPPVPSGFGATLEQHKSTMIRHKADGYDIEEWHLPDGSVVVEVSAKGLGDANQIASFRTFVTNRLISKGAKPLLANKSESSAYRPKKPR